jgi:hypothetical protein
MITFLVSCVMMQRGVSLGGVWLGICSGMFSSMVVSGWVLPDRMHRVFEDCHTRFMREAGMLVAVLARPVGKAPAGVGRDLFSRLRQTRLAMDETSALLGRSVRETRTRRPAMQRICEAEYRLYASLVGLVEAHREIREQDDMLPDDLQHHCRRTLLRLLVVLRRLRRSVAAVDDAALVAFREAVAHMETELVRRIPELHPRPYPLLRFLFALQRVLDVAEDLRLDPAMWGRS